MAALLPCFASAYETWDGTTMSASLQGSGTEDEPYQIWTAADFYYLQQHEELWEYGIYFEQNDDIDLGGHPIEPIGWGTSSDSSMSSKTNNSTHSPFRGVYDGKGYTIYNPCIDWSEGIKNSKKYAQGLFGFFCGTLRNIHIDGAKVTRKDTSATGGGDMKIGILVGSLTPDRQNDKEAIVENIIITNSEIYDGGTTANCNAYFVGSVVGDVSSSNGGWQNITADGYGYVYIRNIYADVDINMSSTTVSSDCQFNIGGILGRLRHGKYSDLPTYCFFTGDIKAPYASIAPLVGISRHGGGNNTSGLTSAYAWEVMEVGTLKTSPITINGEAVYPEINRMYGNYRVYDNVAGDYVTVTDAYPLPVESRYNIRTLDQSTSSEVSYSRNTDKLRAWQGASHGTYANIGNANGRVAVSNMLNENSREYGGASFVWNQEGTSMNFTTEISVALIRSTLHTITAKAYNTTSGNNYTYRWTVNCADGTSKTIDHKSKDGTAMVDGYTITAKNGSCDIILPDAVEAYTSVSVRFYDSLNNLLGEDIIEIMPVTAETVRTIVKDDSGNNDHYMIEPYFIYEGQQYSIDSEFFKNTTFVWEVLYDGGLKELSTTPFNVATGDSRIAGISNAYVGTVRLTIYDNEISGKQYPIYSNGEPYIEQTIQQLHLSVAIYEYNPSTKTYQEFKASDYFSDNKGYNLEYTTTTTDQGYGSVTFSDGTVGYLTSANTHGTIDDTEIRPLILKATVVDQFGNDWMASTNRDKWRIQWSYRIPGDGQDDERKSPNYDAELGYNLINGKYDKTNTSTYGLLDNTKGSVTDWVGAYYRARNNSDTNFTTDRWGEYQVDSVGTRLIIHPNILHRTSAFWIKASLYNVDGDPNGDFPSETEITFNQLAVDFEKERDADGNVTNYKAKVVWRGMDRDVTDDSNVYTSSSSCTYTWWSSSDPADPNSWTEVVVHTNDPSSRLRLDMLHHDGDGFTVDPNLYYKFNFHTTSGTDLTDIVGPVNIVFLYDKGQSINNSDKHSFDSYCTATNQYYPVGLNINNGHDPQNAVSSIERAYELLDSYADGGTMETNKIVVMGFYSNSSYLAKSDDSQFAKPTTLSGAYGNMISGGAWGLLGAEHHYMSAPLKLENLDVYQNGTSTEYHLYCYNHDFTIGEGVRMCNFQTLSTSMGLAEDVKVVNSTLVIGRFNDNTDMRDPANDISYYGNVVDSITTVKLMSGAFGRIIVGARNKEVNGDAKNVFGSPWAPNRVHLTIDMEHKTDNFYEFMPPINSSTQFTHEIGMLVGGQTDGSVYSDVMLDVYECNISRFVAGNITWGRSISNYPEDSFFGSTVLNIYGGQIDELYGGCLGRRGEGSGAVKGYMYGRSIINLYGGTIGTAESTGTNLYAAGAGCITGMGKNWNTGISNEDTYTPDECIPYYDSTRALKYGKFDVATAAGNTIPSMDLYDYSDQNIQETLNLADTYVEANLYGGTVYGDVYGGSYGYSNMFDGKETIVPARKLNDGTYWVLGGTLYGDAHVNLLFDGYNPEGVTVKGNVYGGGAGYGDYKKTDGYNFEHIAKVFGNTKVRIEHGTVTGDVYAAGMGIEGHSYMAAVYGNSTLEMVGGEVQGNIYGGGAYSDLCTYTDNGTTKGGDASVTIDAGTIGNCIFGGGLGSDTQGAHVYGNTTVNINGGYFSADPLTADNVRKNFNIYGGGYYNGYVAGNTYVTAKASPLVYDSSLGLDAGQSFEDAWNDITFRRFCIYGGGWGENALVKGNANVTVDINAEDIGHAVTPPADTDITSNVLTQTFFDVAGGGYSGDIGYWVDGSGKPTSELSQPKVEDYAKYVGGDVTVTIKGAPYIRKVIGGGFYAQCNNTDTYIYGGTIKEVYGGALMGYVHNNGRLNIGTALVDRLNPHSLTAAEVADLNSNLFITDNVYGGNDVKGIVGTVMWKDQADLYDGVSDGLESTDGEPLFTADVTAADNKGVTMILNGGTIMGNVYGAGNGHYRGYYVPGWARYGDGPARQYRTVYNPKTGKNDGLVYRCRPMVGKVSMEIGGNSETDRVNIKGNVYGGGRACTVGQWNTILPFEDPRRLAKGGFLHINVGSHVTVEGSVYMGAQGSEFAEMHTVPAGINLATFDGSTTEELNKLGDVAYDHWYYHPVKGYYVPGFPKAGTTDGNFGIYAEHMFRAYVKNIEMNGDTELTFYDNPFEMEDDKVVYSDELGNRGYVTEDGKFVYTKDKDGNTATKDKDNNIYPVRKRWVPGELAVDAYDAEDIVFANFFGGGSCGSMTNNQVMKYDFTSGSPLKANDTPEKDHQIENYGSIYRYTLPAGLKVLDRVVGGSENASFKVYKYSGTDDNEDYTELLEDDDHVRFTFDGGLVTQGTYSYYQIIYNDVHDTNTHTFPDNLETLYSKYSSSYTMKDGTTIYPYKYTDKSSFPNGNNLSNSQYWMALQSVDGSSTNLKSYCGAREDRVDQTVLKLTVRAEFDPQEGEHDYDPDWANDDTIDPTEHFIHYGGIIYGGCYESGVLQGDVIVSVASNTIGNHLSARDTETFGQISTLQHNVGRVFGGGYGPDSRIDGDTYVNLLKDFVGMNVFGGGCQGPVNGTCNVQYLGDEANSYVFGSIYGGGLYGNVGVEYDPTTGAGTPIATNVKLYSGNVDKVYGGSCLGNLFGRTNVELCDQVYSELDHFDYDKANKENFISWGGARLIAGTVFGGNDISGNINAQPDAPLSVDSNGNKTMDPLGAYSTYVYVHEEPDIDKSTSTGSNAPMKESVNPGKDTPGSCGDYNGFPLIGNLYGGSDGNYGEHTADGKYATGIFKMATGISNHVAKIYLGGTNAADFDPNSENLFGDYEAQDVPHVERAYLDIQGGTLINVYGGGDKSTINKETKLSVDYKYVKAANVSDEVAKQCNDSIMDARAGFDKPNNSDVIDPLVRVWNTFHLSDDEQIEEVTSTSIYDETTSETIFKYHIYRIFGGNDNADMAIQPTWNLVRGHVGSVYSGGNFGKMTYFGTDNTDPANPKYEALKLVIDSRDFHTDAVFGGGRVGDIEPAVPENIKVGDDFYGATLEIHEGVVDHVYGGNDVSGNVQYGARVNITGAISGDVYCAGNGNYRYQYDPSIKPGNNIEERYDSEYGGRYFVLPQKSVYGDSLPTDGEKLLAINAYRPNVERAHLSIAGKEGAMAYVRGNVYCGGNSSTVNANPATAKGDIRFDIGDYVALNGVYLGSNGESLVDPSMMSITEQLNGIDLSKANDVEEDDTKGYGKEAPLDVDASDHNTYATMLDLYMRAVEINGLPKDFQLKKDLKEAYIGDFFVGGNSGSMLTDKTISLTFPYNLVIFNKIVGGSNNANVTYKGVTHVGGLTTPLDPAYTDKVYLQVRSQFKPLKLLYPINEDYRAIDMVPDLVRDGDDVYFPEGKCSIFGGCFNSGKTVGNIHIDLYSDMVKEYDEETKKKDIELLQKYFADSLKGVDFSKIDALSKERIIVNGIDKLQRRSFALIGGGYGSNTEVRGDIKLHMLPGQLHPDYWNGTEKADKDIDESPSTATIFGGSQQGLVVGNTEIAVRDGMVLSNMYGGSEASVLYGSTQIIIGWPQYYICQKSGRYVLDRTDKISKAAKNDWVNSDNASKLAVLKEIWLRKGEYVSVNLYNSLSEKQPYVDGFLKGDKDVDDTYFKLVKDDTPHEYATHNNSDYITFHNITWDDIDIYIGNNKSRRDSREEYFAHGNIYGGGFITSSSTVSLAGQYTVQKFKGQYYNEEADLGYGGNSSIMIWDNIENRNPKNEVGGKALYDESDFNGIDETKGSGAKVRDHITIGTGRYVPVDTVYVGMDIIGKYIFKEGSNGKFENDKGKTGYYEHQSSHVLTADDLKEGGTYHNVTFYEIESDGGVYGGGRKVYVEGFRNCDLAYYGYADYSPQYPKLLNTAQRLDLFSVTDCCLFFEGANDFATNSIDATNYSLTRIGELQMHSSIKASDTLDPGERQEDGLRNTLHTKSRIRNYVAFFNDVHYLAAITSSESFDNQFRGADGKFYSVGDYGEGNHESSSIPSGYDYVSLNSPTEYDETNGFTYKDFKTNRINNYYKFRDLPDKDSSGNALTENQNLKTRTSLEFDQRNIGTAANMIGINNGYTLKIQGAVVDKNNDDQIYFGPVTGVFEIKLMTLAANEGGGYIYALNQHEKPSHFLETTGNFVFPGAAYKVKQDNTGEYNYIHDDCFPMGEGWDKYYGWTGSQSSSSQVQRNSRTESTDTDTHGNCNEEQEVHYWYVNGSHYFYHVTLTAYTYNNSASFTLNNTDDLVYLYGVGDGSRLNLESVTWSPITSTNTVYSSDLQDIKETYKDDKDVTRYKKDYRLYLTVDNNPSIAHDPTSTAETGYAVMVPRANAAIDSDTLASDDKIALMAAVRNNYSSVYSETIANKPLLGISLYDMIDNSGSEYYQNHLAEPENALIVLTSQNGDTEFRYTINLKIRYLLGPSITGAPVIENDALPGEYIYANAYGVNVDLDEENMAITERNWYLFDPRYDTSNAAELTQIIKKFDNESPQVSAERINDYKLDNDRQVQIPAAYYRDGWNLVYEIIANGMPFYLTPKAAENTYEQDSIVVHNYHRMCPSINAKGRAATVEDIPLTAGARVYIEDDEDMAYFFTWLKEKGNEPYASAQKAPDGKAINPQYADSLHFYLMTDVKMPTEDVSALKFRGHFHGQGHTVDMGQNTMFIGDNQGGIYDTGFVSDLDNINVFGVNSGKVENCFYYNTSKKGKMFGSSTGTVYNSYTSSVEAVDGLTVADDEMFADGTVAYNLNAFYLMERYNQGNANNPNLVDESLVEPIANYYSDGDYRYATLKGSTAWGLRTAQTPNYRDYLGIRVGITAEQYSQSGVTGANATMHDMAHTADPTREQYEKDGVVLTKPNYPDDYLFFGQTIGYDNAEAYPSWLGNTKRVYRASGFYGSKQDRGYHFNQDAVVLNSKLTAIDFAGVRDAEGDYAYSLNYDSASDSCKVWFAPTIDVPDSDDMNLGLTSFDNCYVNDKGEWDSKATRNLLVYRPESMTLLDDMTYDITMPETDVFGHVVNVGDTIPSTDCLQLVDLEDFNCPIEFDVNQTVWYRRLPSTFSQGSDGWEGICLPFTARTVYGSVETRIVHSPLNHGELSHFYGPSVGKDAKAESHEYWLRKFTGIKDSKAYFARPGSEDDTNSGNVQEEKRAKYHYSNTYFSNVYGSSYNDPNTTHLLQVPAYTEDGVDYTNYPMLTARYPYIVSYPGARFYEFDCSGKFYANMFGGDAVAQIITYAWNREEGETTAQKIKVSDDNKPVVFTHDGYVNRGTYMHYTAEATDMVIDADANGSTLVRPDASEDRVVYPFRTYFSRSTSDSKPMQISSRGIDEIVPDEEDGDDAFGELRIWADGSELVVDSPYEESFHLTVFNVKGQAVRMIEVNEGENRYRGFSPGFYLIRNTKVMLSK